jgi:hypothetical protein
VRLGYYPLFITRMGGRHIVLDFNAEFIDHSVFMAPLHLCCIYALAIQWPD